MKRRVGTILIGIGLALLAVWAAARLHTFFGERRDRAAFEAARAAAARTPPAPPATPTPTPIPLVEGPVDTALWSPKRIQEWKESLAADHRAPLALLKMPRLGIDVPVLEGTDDLTLNRGAGWIEGTARPGESGNIGISAHRDGFFRALKDVTLGDEIVLETPAGTSRYVVTWTKIVGTDDVSVLDATPGASVTLVTCYPFYFIGSAPQRFIVRASPPPAPAANAAASVR